MLSSARVGQATRVLRMGPLRIPLTMPEVRLLRKSRPFWSILGDHRIWSTVLRVPVTFPPDEFYGAELSAMAVPDLLGTQGTYLLYTTRPLTDFNSRTGYQRQIAFTDDSCETTLEGPDNTLRDHGALSVPLRMRIDRKTSRVHIEIGGSKVQLRVGTLSDWVQVTFPALPGVSVRGITRLLVTELGEHFTLYVSPINLDPDAPAMPISHPRYYATYLARKIGAFATLGLAEDTSARNDGVTDDSTFLQQTYDIDTERERMFLTALDRLRRGSLVCVFDATDRIQHMFWRELDASYPAAGHEQGANADSHAIRDLYRHNDALVGRVLQRLDKDDVLMVISDHGFNSFRRGVNLNAWLHREGYLTLKKGTDGTREWLRDVDWSATRAYALGLTGLFLNLKGREAHGIVQPGADALALKTELAHKLRGLHDDEHPGVAINEAFDTSTLYAGPYLENAPDFVIGYNAGYRASWSGASGVVAGAVFTDNTKPWSGDHCIDPRLVPGVFFCNRPVNAAEPALVDIAPTALRLFGIEPPSYMDGRPLAGLA
jgi:predicted AlkP superfamily phosphohydrolase/phosphomutase